MPDTYQMVSRVTAAVLLLMVFAASLAAAQPANEVQAGSLAGQMCPQGAYVIGFDGAGNIVCSQVCGNGRLDAGEGCDDGNTVGGDGCSVACQSEVAAVPAPQVAPVARDATPAAVAAPAAAAAVKTTSAPTSSPATAPATTPATAPQLAVTDVEPSSVLYGAREVTLTISGTGFHSGTAVLFDGSTYQPSVNAAGTTLEVTVPTGRLAMGRYPIKVTNGPDQVVKWSKALVVF